jgi:hypothetical protein
VTPNGDVIVAWTLQGSDYLFYRVWSAGSWGPVVDVAATLLHSAGDYPLFFDVVADSSSEPHFIVAGYFPLLTGSPTCTSPYCALELAPDGTGGWIQTQLGSWAGGGVDAIRTPANDFLVTIGGTGRPIRFVTKSSGVWTQEDIPGTNSIFRATISLGSSGPVVIFQNNSGADQWTRRGDRGASGWTITQLPFKGTGFGAVDATNAAHVAYSWWKAYPGSLNQLASYMWAPDVAAPAVGGLSQRFPTGGITSSTVPVAISWSAHDALSGLSRYELQRRIGTGAWSGLGSAFTTAAVTASLTPGSSVYQFRVRGWDRAGNVSPWAYSTTFTIGRYEDSSTYVHYYGGTWASSSSTSYSGGTTRYATVAGRYSTFTFSGFGFAWVTATGPTRGTARVYVNGVLWSNLSLYSTSTTYRKMVFQFRGGTASYTFKVVVVGTAGHPRVDIDSLLVLR